MSIKYRKWLASGLAFLLSTALFAALSGGSLADPGPKYLIRADVTASLGGTFTDDPVNPGITITIPPGALTADAELEVELKTNPKPVGGNQTAASPAFKIELEKAGDDDDSDDDKNGDKLELTRPMKVAITANPAPVHPQLGEIAIRENGKWQRMTANFYRASTSTVVTLTQRTEGQFRVAHRTLQARTGPEVERGRVLYFDETWGDEAFFGDLFQLHEVLNAVDPFTAAGVGAQIDITKVPQPIVDVLIGDDYDAKVAALGDPATTRALIKADAVLGIKGIFDDPVNPDRLTSVGLTCALCHVTVTPTSFQLAPPPADPVPLPIGMPVLGPPNTKMNAGLILSLTPLVQTGSENPNIDQYQSWGPGNFDARFLPGNPLDDHVNNPSSIPPHWNYVDLAEQEYTITWPGILRLRPDNNSLGAGPGCGIDLVLGVNGAFLTPNAAIQNFEIANPIPPEIEAALIQAEIDEPGTVLQLNDLLDLEAFLQSIVSPPPGAFDEAKAEAGMALFYGKANCVACHETAEGTGDEGFFTNIVVNPPQGLLAIGIKTPGLRGLAFTAPYFHDGSAATLADVVARYTSPDIPETPPLTAAEQEAVVEYLKSL